MEIKILNIITSGLKREGISTTQREFIKNMDMTNVRMDMLAVHDNDDAIIKEFEQMGCNVTIMPDRKKETLKYCWELCRLIKKNKYDIVHVHGSSALLSIELCSAMLCGVKVRIAHSRNTSCDNKRMDKFLRPLFYSSYTDAFACGWDAGEWLFGNRKFTVIHNGKDLEKFRYAPDIRNKIRRTYMLEGKTVIGTVGSLNKQKNHVFLIDVFNLIHKSNKNTSLFIMGEGEKRSEIEDKISEYKLEDSVVLTGRISNVDEMLQGMDIMLLPSLHEGLPNVVLEWQASGLVSLIADTVTKECKASDLVSFLPIDKGVQLWADAVKAVDCKYDRNKASEVACEKLAENGFDIKENAINMKNKYIELVNKGR